MKIVKVKIKIESDVGEPKYVWFSVGVDDNALSKPREEIEKNILQEISKSFKEGRELIHRIIEDKILEGFEIERS